MLNILIIDDELPARRRLRRLLEPMTGYRVAGEAGSGDEALEVLEHTEADVLLLDISMPGLDGMGLARVLRERDTGPPAVIFCTAWPDQALDAFEIGAVDYVVKPVRAQRLEEALDKAAKYVGGPRPRSFLTSTLGARTELIDVDSIACLLSEDKYTMVFHAGRKTVVDQSLVELENLHGDVFLRVHRNALVARDRIRALERSDHGPSRLLLDGCDFKPQVSRRQLPAIRKLIREQKL